jgi:hypothetical protein
MYVRVVRFTDVSPERIADIKQRVSESDGAPEGVPTSAIQILVDEAQGTAIVLQHYDSAEDMAEGERILEAMDSSETPGTRASVDKTEVLIERKA